MTNPHFSQVDPPRAVRPPYRPPIGVPAAPAVGWRGFLSSVGVHALILLLVLLPALLQSVLPREVESAGGPGPAGGGGGGRGGTGGAEVRERLHYIQVAPPPLAPTPAAVVPPVVPPVVVPPKPAPVPPPLPQPSVPTPQPPAETAGPAPADAAPVEGTGGGTGNDGSAGSGPGSGGGVGSGVGTGRGSGVGPGTGGGNGTVYTPQPLTVFIPPVPAPSKVRGKEIVAEFDVDSTGRVLSVTFTPTADGGYNKRLRELFAEMKWRPATKPDGTPVRAKATFAYTL